MLRGWCYRLLEKTSRMYAFKNLIMKEKIKIIFYDILILMLFISFQVSTFATLIEKKIYYLTLLGIVFFLVTNRLTIQMMVVLFCASLLSLWIEPKLISLVMVFVFGYSWQSQNKANTQNILTFIVAVNFLFLFVQLTAISNTFYISTNYNGEFTQIGNLFEAESTLKTQFPLVQLRPSGIFPSTVYLSQACIFLSYVFAIRQELFSRYYMFLLALSLVISGSTASIFMAIGIFLFSTNRINANCFILIYIACLIVYLYFMPNYIVSYNYSIADFVGSVNSRIPSYFQLKYPHYAIELILTLSFILLMKLYLQKSKYYLKVNRLIGAFFFASIPLIIHSQLLHSIFYAFFLGCVVASIQYIFSRKISVCNSLF